MHAHAACHTSIAIAIPAACTTNDQYSQAIRSYLYA